VLPHEPQQAQKTLCGFAALGDHRHALPPPPVRNHRNHRNHYQPSEFLTGARIMTTLPGSVQSAPANSSGFDCNTVLSLSVAQQFYSEGYRFCVRYLSRSTSQGSGDLSPAEANNILQAGLALMSVQHVAAEGWVPSAALGTTNGTNAANNAKSVGFPPGVNVWLDLEGVASGTAAQTVIDYCNNWYVPVAAAGYVPGIYVGANCILSGSQLYNNLKFQHYWQSLSTVPAIPTRGYQMVQSLVSQPVNGVGIDKDVTQTDQLGGTVLWLKL
jgi:hypothetical protein